MLIICSALLLFGCADDVSPVMWQATSPNGKSGYLLGTLHLGVSANEDLPEQVWDRFNTSSRAVFEAEVRKIPRLEYLALTSLPDGKTLDKLLPQASWTKLVELIQPVSLLTIKKLRPWAVTSEVYWKITPKTEPMDLTLLNKADSSNKGLQFLELWQDQAQAMNKIPLTDDLNALIDLIDNLDTIKSKLNELIDLYKQGDIEGVERLAPPAGVVPDIKDPTFNIFIKKRNQVWLPAIKKQLDRGGAFFAVGFGHLLGEDGLVKMLAKQGYNVQRVE